MQGLLAAEYRCRGASYVKKEIRNEKMWYFNHSFSDGTFWLQCKDNTKQYRNGSRAARATFSNPKNDNGL